MTKSATDQITVRQEQTLDILDRERDVLLKGPLGQLASLVEKRETLLVKVLADTETLSESFLRTLHTKAERNGRLILASLAGFRAAREQIEEADLSARTLRTYTAAGSSVAVAEPPKTRDHRR